MKVEDTAIILLIKKFGEKSALIKVLTENNGLYSGIVSSVNSKINKNMFQVGNQIKLTWTARLAEHVGNIKGEPIKSLSFNIINNKLKLAALSSICSIISRSLPERVNENNVYSKLKDFITCLSLGDYWQIDYINLELLALQEMGFGLDLNRCAATGLTNNLIYVSPRTGKAVSEQAGYKYKNKLLKLPEFLVGGIFSQDQFIDALKLTEYFLTKNLSEYEDQKLPPIRRLLYNTL